MATQEAGAEAERSREAGASCVFFRPVAVVAFFVFMRRRLEEGAESAAHEGSASEVSKRARRPRFGRSREELALPELSDFSTLRGDFPGILQPFVLDRHDGGWKMDFCDPRATLAVTRCLLAKFFGVDLGWTIPLPLAADTAAAALPGSGDSFLIPPVPNRLSYVRWALDRVAGGAAVGSASPTVVEIGTGAGAILPLLATGSPLDAQRPALVRSAARWRVGASEANARALELARSNLEQASPGARARIALVGVDAGGPLALQQRLAALDDDAWSAHVAALRSGGERAVDSGPLLATMHALDQQAAASAPWHADCVLVNPPFFESDAELRPNSRTVCTGNAAEMVTAGGELGFVLAMICDSISLGDRVEWCTSMVGIKRHVGELVRRARVAGAARVLHVRLRQGRTMRWAIAWSMRHGRSDDSSEGRSDDGRSDGEGYSDGAEHSDGVGHEYDADTEALGELTLSAAAIASSALPSESSLEDRVLSALREADPEAKLVVADGVVRARAAGDRWRAQCRVADGARIALCFASSHLSSPELHAVLDRVRGDILRSNRRWRRRLAESHQSLERLVTTSATANPPNTTPSSHA
jgi:23S rRNA A1618 N6-methylase RlmF